MGYYSRIQNNIRSNKNISTGINIIIYFDSVNCGWLCFWKKGRKYNGYVKFTFRNIHISAVATINTLDYDKIMITELKSFDIHEDELVIDMSKDSFKVTIEGGFLGKIIGKIAEFVFSVVNKIAKNAIVKKVQGPIKDLIKEKFVGKTILELTQEFGR